MKNDLLSSSQLLGGPLYVGQYIKLALVGVLLGLYSFKGHVDDCHHHVDQDHVHTDGESKEYPGSHFICGPQTGKVKLPNGHAEGVLDTAAKVFEIPKVTAKNKVKEADK